MIVVIDTNALWDDLCLVGPAWRVLENHHRSDSVVRVVFPDVIVRELVKSYRTQFMRSATNVRDGIRGLNRLGYELEVPQLADPSEAVAAYEKHLRRRLTDANIAVSPLPDIPLDTLVERSLAEKRPFQAKSRGFRDAVIWESVKQCAAVSEVVLISGNDSDFAHSKAKPELLHEHLQDDIAERGLHEVRLMSSLTRFVDSEVPSTPDLATVRRRLERDEAFRRHLEEVIYDELTRFSWRQDDTVTIAESVYGDVQNIQLLGVDDLEYVDIVGAHEADKDRAVLLDVIAAAWITFSFTADTALIDWLRAHGADVEFDTHEETWSQGHTMPRPTAVRFAIEYSLDEHELGPAERGPASDAMEGDDGVITVSRS